MPKVIILNNYPLDTVWDEVRRGDTPDHVLFGVNYFAERGYECEFIPCRDGELGRMNRWLEAIRFPFPLGDLQQQREVLKRLDAADIIYAACGGQSAGLACLRALGFLRKPIVCVVHHPLNRGKLSWLRAPFFSLVVKGTDALPCLSRCISEEIGGSAFEVSWGPDAKFYQKSESTGSEIVAFGRTGRDFSIFGRAATIAGTPAKILCLQSHVTTEFRAFGKNVEVLAKPNEKSAWMKYPELCGHLGRARVIAIPLAEQDCLAGLTSLMDALGLGRPVIMSRNRHVNLDIEAEGIGRWVEPGDVDGWVNALRWFQEHPEESAEMGGRARTLVDRGFNSVSFANRIMDIFDQLLQKP